MKVFGIGCVYFGFIQTNEDDPSEFYNQNIYFETLKRLLEEIENISEVRFYNTNYDEYGAFISIEHNDKEITVPVSRNDTRIQFDAFIPFRVQEQLISRCDVETMHIDITYGYEMPLIVVSYDWPDEEGDAQPSMAVAVLRKFLEKKMSGTDLICGSVGPSPFHANFSMIESELTEIPSIEDTSENYLGYANFELNSSSDSNLMETIRSLNLDTIFSAFYHLSELRSRAINAQYIILENSRNLLEGKNPNNLMNKIRAFRSQSESVDHLNSNIFKEMLLRLNITQALADSDRQEITGVNSKMNRFFDEYRSIAAEETWQRFSSVANFFEERRQKMIGNAAAIAAGIVGGVIGSVIGSVATYLLTRVG
ncbi:hypothetical protein [Sphingomonas sp. GB1N7]|uniref:hypothetical protein n=1 Tax=Parasphingomonas caseinilytica TaxID=3096158 RepID=UPI002FC953A6